MWTVLWHTNIPLTYLGDEEPQTASPKSIINLGFVSLCYKPAEGNPFTLFVSNQRKHFCVSQHLTFNLLNVTDEKLN